MLTFEGNGIVNNVFCPSVTVTCDVPKEITYAPMKFRKNQ
jgi:hypothetical protein